MTERRPGEWPVTRSVDVLEPSDEQGQAHLELARVQARFQLVLDSIRADLEEQPSARCVRAAARRWTDAIAQLTDEVARRPRDTG